MVISRLKSADFKISRAEKYLVDLKELLVKNYPFNYIIETKKPSTFIELYDRAIGTRKN